MSIVFQCESERLKSILTGYSYLSSLHEGHAAGYDGKNAGAVWKQFQDIYAAVKKEIVKENPSIENMDVSAWKKQDFYLNENPAILSATEKGDTPLDAAIYTILALRNQKLHPVLIFSEEKTAVGVWLYSDFDMGESRIRAEEFIYEAYDCGGMLLPVSMNSLVEDLDFSQGVMDGCEIVRNYIEALDVRLENGEDISQDFAEMMPICPAEEEMVFKEEDSECCNLFRKLSEMCPDITSGKKLAEKIIALLNETGEELDSRSEFRYRRYLDALEKMKGYNSILCEQTIGDFTLSDLIEKSETAGVSGFCVDISEDEGEILFSEQSLSLMERYTEAWENCRYKAPDGKLCFDLTQLSLEQVKTFYEMLKKGEKRFSDFLKNAKRFCSEIGLVYEFSEKEDLRSFLAVCMKICSFLMECSHLKELMEETEGSEETAAERQEVDEYQTYIQYREQIQAVKEWLDLKRFSELSEENQRILCNLSKELLQTDLDSIHIPISRDLTECSRKLQEKLLECGVYKLDKMLKIQSGNGKNQQLKRICQSIVQSEIHSYNWVHTEYDHVHALFADTISENGHLFHIQKKVSINYANLMTEECIDEKIKKMLREIVEWVKTNHPAYGSYQSILSHADDLVYDYYQPFHEIEKDIFHFLELSYVEFDENYEDRMLIDFILDWKKMIENGEVMQECKQAYTALLRNCFSPILKQVMNQKMTPYEFSTEFRKLWYQKNAELWLKKKEFDLPDYLMSEKIVHSLSQQILQDCCKLQKNLLLKQFHSIWEGKEETISVISEMNSMSDICRNYESLIEESFELLTFSDERYKLTIKEKNENIPELYDHFKGLKTDEESN